MGTRRFIIHAGLEKTGSTAIQNLIWDNVDVLQEMGVHCPTTLGRPGHVKLTAAATAGQLLHPLRALLQITDEDALAEFRSSVIYRLSRELDGTVAQRVLISDEHIAAYLNNSAMMAQYADLVMRFGEVEKIIVYLRRQDKYALSRFSEGVKVGRVDGFNLDSPLAPPSVIGGWIDYPAILQRLSEAFGRDKIDVRVFRRDRLEGGDVRVDFLRALGLKPGRFNISDATFNRGLDGRIVRALAELAQGFPPDRTRAMEGVRRYFVDEAHRIFRGPPMRLSPDAHAAFLATFTKHNRLIKELYFPGTGASVFEPIDNPAPGLAQSYYPANSLSLSDVLYAMRRGTVDTGRA